MTFAKNVGRLGLAIANIPLGSTYNASRDCPPPRRCVVEKIADFIKVLTDKKASREQRAEALKFVVHFVGDIHQPMHATKESEGGNGVHVLFLRSDRCGPYDCNLVYALQLAKEIRAVHAFPEEINAGHQDAKTRIDLIRDRLKKLKGMLYQRRANPAGPFSNVALRV